MQFEKILKKVYKHGFKVEKYTTQRAWIKSAFLYIECYVVPCLAATDDAAENITLSLLQTLLQKRNELAGSPTQDPEIFENTLKVLSQLPTKKKFLPVKNLIKKNEQSCHGCITLKDYGSKEDSTCVLTDWNRSPCLLIGYIYIDDCDKLSFRDHSSNVECHVIGDQVKYINTVCLLAEWNYLPQGLLEITAAPSILLDLKPEVNVVSTLPAKRRCRRNSVDQTGLITISGRVFRVLWDEGSFIILIFPHQCESLEDSNGEKCTSHPSGLVSIVCLLKEWWAEFIHPGIEISMSGLDKNSKFSRHDYSTRRDTVMSVSSDVDKLLQQYTDTSTIISTNFSMPTYCPVYTGTLTNTQWPDILILDNMKAVVFRNQHKQLQIRGLRVGAVISIKCCHKFTISNQLYILCCTRSTIQVLKHSRLSGTPLVPAYKDENHIFESLHPCGVIEICKFVNQMKNESAEHGTQICPQRLSTLLAHCSLSLGGSSEVIPPEACTVMSSFSLNQSSRCFLTLQEIHDNALEIAKQNVHNRSENEQPDYWYTTIHCRDLIPPEKYTSTCDLVVVVKLDSDDTGSCVLTDHTTSIPCVVTCGHQKNMQQCHEPQYPCTQDIGVWLKLKNFTVLLEQIWCVKGDGRAQSPECTVDSEGIPVDKTLHNIIYIALNHHDAINVSMAPQNTTVIGCSLSSVYPTTPKESILTPDSISCAQPTTSSQTVNIGSKTSIQTVPPLLMFVLHKSQLLKSPKNYNSFTFTGFIFPKSSAHNEQVLQFTHTASKWFSFVLPGKLVCVQPCTKSGTDTFISDQKTSKMISLTECKVQHIHCASDLPATLNEEEVFSFYCKARKFWSESNYSKGIEKILPVVGIRRIHDATQSPLVAIEGYIWKKLLFRDSISWGAPFNLKVLLALPVGKTLSLFMNFVKVENFPLGLLRGSKVIFYRVRLHLSQKGTVYFKYTPTSYHVVTAVCKPEPVRNFDQDKSDHHRKKSKHSMKARTPRINYDTIGPRTLLYTVCSEFFKEKQYVPYLLKVSLLRILKVEILLKCESCNTNFSKPCACNGSKRKLHEKPRIELYSKCIVTDGTARAIFHFSNNQPSEFCKFLQLELCEFTDIISLLRSTTTCSFKYDFDIFDGAKSLASASCKQDDAVKSFLVALFQTMNTEIKDSVAVVATPRMVHEQKPRKTKAVVAADSAYEVGTVPLDDRGDCSVRALRIKMIHFNCELVK